MVSGVEVEVEVDGDSGLVSIQYQNSEGRDSRQRRDSKEEETSQIESLSSPSPSPSLMILPSSPLTTSWPLSQSTVKPWQRQNPASSSHRTAFISIIYREEEKTRRRLGASSSLLNCRLHLVYRRPFNGLSYYLHPLHLLSSVTIFLQLVFNCLKAYPVEEE